MTIQTYASLKLPAPKSAFTPAPSGLLQRKCACGGTPGPSGKCQECQRKRLENQPNQRAKPARTDVQLVQSLLGTSRTVHSLRNLRIDKENLPFPQPQRKSPDAEIISDEDDEFATTHTLTSPTVLAEEEAKPARHAHLHNTEQDDLPHQGSATIVCDGSGGYRVSMGWAATARCGIGDCVRRHEQSHITDWQSRYPNGCRNADGSAKPDGTTVPTGGAGYADFLRQSECRAYRVEIPCEQALLDAGPSASCRTYIQGILDDSRRQETHYCT